MQKLQKALFQQKLELGINQAPLKAYLKGNIMTGKKTTIEQLCSRSMHVGHRCSTRSAAMAHEANDERQKSTGALGDATYMEQLLARSKQKASELRLHLQEHQQGGRRPSQIGQHSRLSNSKRASIPGEPKQNAVPASALQSSNASSGRRNTEAQHRRVATLPYSSTSTAARLHADAAGDAFSPSSPSPSAQLRCDSLRRDALSVSKQLFTQETKTSHTSTATRTVNGIPPRHIRSSLAQERARSHTLSPSGRARSQERHYNHHASELSGAIGVHDAHRYLTRSVTPMGETTAVMRNAHLGMERPRSTLGGMDTYEPIRRRHTEQEQIENEWNQRRSAITSQVVESRKQLSTELAQLKKEKQKLCSANAVYISQYVDATFFRPKPNGIKPGDQDKR